MLHCTRTNVRPLTGSLPYEVQLQEPQVQLGDSRCGAGLQGRVPALAKSLLFICPTALQAPVPTQAREQQFCRALLVIRPKEVWTLL